MDEISAKVEISCAIRSRRDFLMKGWLESFQHGNMTVEYGCGFWAKQMERLHDAAIVMGFGYSF